MSYNDKKLQIKGLVHTHGNDIGFSGVNSGDGDIPWSIDTGIPIIALGPNKIYGYSKGEAEWLETYRFTEGDYTISRFVKVLNEQHKRKYGM